MKNYSGIVSGLAEAIREIRKEKEKALTQNKTMNKPKKCAKCGIGENKYAGCVRFGIHDVHEWVDQEPPKAEGKTCPLCGRKGLKNIFECDCDTPTIHIVSTAPKADERPWWMDEFDYKKINYIEKGGFVKGIVDHCNVYDLDTDLIKNFISKTLSEFLRRAAKKVIELGNKESSLHGCNRCWSDDIDMPCTCESEKRSVMLAYEKAAESIISDSDRKI